MPVLCSFFRFHRGFFADDWPGEPASAAEVAEDVVSLRRIRDVGHPKGEHARSATCSRTSPGHWTCAARYPDGSTTTVFAIWYGRARVLGFSYTRRPQSKLII